MSFRQNRGTHGRPKGPESRAIRQLTPSSGDSTSELPTIRELMPTSPFPDTYTHQGVPTLLHWTARRAALRPNPNLAAERKQRYPDAARLIDY
jgi:hypothetical protein